VKLTLEPTDKIQLVNGLVCRRWEGTTADGVPVHAYVLAVSPQTHDVAVNEQFQRELLEIPSRDRPAEIADFDYYTAFDLERPQ
jgi:hypothetical protein